MPVTHVVDTGVDGQDDNFFGQKQDVAPDGRWWSLLPSGSSLRFFFSDDEGETWTQASGSLTGNNAQFLIDEDGYFHIIYSGGVLYRRGVVSGNTISWSSAFTVQSQSRYRALSLAVHKYGSGYRVHVLSSRYYTESTSTTYLEVQWRSSFSSHVSSDTGASHTHGSTPWYGEGITPTTPPVVENGVWTHVHSWAVPGQTAREYTGDDHTHDFLGWSQTGETRNRTTSSTSHYSHVVHHILRVSSNGNISTEAKQEVDGDYGNDSHSPVGFITSESVGERSRETGGLNLHATWVRGNGTVYFATATYSEGSWGWSVSSTITPSPYDNRAFDATWDGSSLWVVTHDGGTVLLYKDGVEETSTMIAPDTEVRSLGVSYDNEGRIWVFVSDDGDREVWVRTYDGATWTITWTILDIDARFLGIVSKGHPGGSRIDGFVLDGNNRYHYIQGEILIAPPRAPILISPLAGSLFGSVTFLWEHRDRVPTDQYSRIFAIRHEDEANWSYIVSGNVESSENDEVTNSEEEVLVGDTFDTLGGVGRYYWRVATYNDLDDDPSPYSETASFRYRRPTEGWGAVGVN